MALDPKVDCRVAQSQQKQVNHIAKTTDINLGEDKEQEFNNVGLRNQTDLCRKSQRQQSNHRNESLNSKLVVSSGKRHCKSRNRTKEVDVGQRHG